MMKYVSVCSGIEAATVAWGPLGWEPLWFSEVEPFCCTLLNHYYPGIPNLGDMTKITEGDIERFPQADVLVGGTPCQSFSVAGLRKGMADPRGNLALRFFQLTGILRPRWLLWENVPGVLSSDGGRDFGSILGALAELGYGFAYRILDAQYFGVPQRRRRVFVVGHLGDWRRAAAVLLERASLRRDSKPSRESGTVVAHSLARGACGSHGRYDPNGEDYVVGPLQSHSKEHGHAMTTQQAGQVVASTLRARDAAKGVDSDCTDTLLPVPIHNADIGSNVGEMGHLRAGNGNETGGVPFVEHKMAVRRLTPRECERLQGFPGGYTNIPYGTARGRAWILDQKCSDGPRYRALGNSMAVPVMRWIGRRIILAATPP